MDATSLPGPGDLLVLDHVTAAANKRRRPVLLVLNKIDLVNKIKLLPVLESYARLLAWTEVVPVSAQTGDCVQRWLTVAVSLLPEGEGADDEATVGDPTRRTWGAEVSSAEV